MTETMQANLSPLAARLSVTPISSASYLAAGTVINTILTFLESVALLLYSKFVWNADLLVDAPRSLLLLITLAYVAIFPVLALFMGGSMAPGDAGQFEPVKLDVGVSQEMAVVMQPKQNEIIGPSESRTAFLSSFAYILTLLATTLIPLISEPFSKPGVRMRTTIAPCPVRYRAIQMILGSSIIVFGFTALLLTATLPVTHTLFEPGQTGKILVNCLLYALAFLGMSYVISVLVRSRVAYLILGMIIVRFSKRSRKQLAT